MGDDNKLELDDKGRTNLQRKILNMDNDVIDYIKNNDVDVLEINTIDKAGKTALHLAIYGTLPKYRANIVKALLSVPGIDPNIIDNYGYTPLSWAVVANDCESVATMVGFDIVDINQIDHSTGKTMLEVANKNGFKDIVNILKIKLEESSETSEGNNKLQKAIINGELIDNLMVNVSAEDINHKNNDGKTALHLAAALNNCFNYNYVFILSQHEDLDATIVDDFGNPAMFSCNSAQAVLFMAFRRAREIAENFRGMDNELDSSILSFFKSDPIKELKNDVVNLTKKIIASNDKEIIKSFQDLCTDPGGVLGTLIDHNRYSDNKTTQTRNAIESLLAPKSGCRLFSVYSNTKMSLKP